MLDSEPLVDSVTSLGDGSVASGVSTVDGAWFLGCVPRSGRTSLSLRFMLHTSICLSFFSSSSSLAIFVLAACAVSYPEKTRLSKTEKCVRQSLFWSIGELVDPISRPTLFNEPRRQDKIYGKVTLL